MKSFVARVWAWLAPDLRTLRTEEPARLAARYAQAVTVLAAAGITIPHLVDYRIGIALAAWGVIAPWVQGRKTRADVWSPQTAQDLADLARLFPGLAHEAEKLLAAGWSKWEAYLRLDQLAQPAPEPAAPPAAPAPPVPAAPAAGLDVAADPGTHMGRDPQPLPIEAEAQAAAAQAAPAPTA